MSFLPNPIELKQDETIESALLRLCKANHFEHYNDLSVEVRSWLEEHHPTVAGAFPLALDAVNVYHSKQSSAKRVQALELLEKLVGLPKFALLDISFKHTSALDCGQFSEVRYKQITIPKIFLRSTSIPICVECLKKENYVRFDWHIKPVMYCTKHDVKLISECPACHTLLNYMISEDPTRCVCGQSLLLVKGLNTGADGWRNWRESDHNSDALLSNQLAVMLMMNQFFPNLSFEEFVSNHRYHINSYLQQIIEMKSLLATSKTNRIGFGYFTDDFLNKVSRIGSLPQTIAVSISSEIIELALKEPRSTVANIGDSLVSIREAALITGSTVEELYRLYESGVLLLAKYIRDKGKLESYKPAFRLRDVASIALSYSRFGYNQSAW